MAEPLGDDARMESGFEQERRGRVPEVVEPDPWQSRARNERVVRPPEQVREQTDQFLLHPHPAAKEAWAATGTPRRLDRRAHSAERVHQSGPRNASPCGGKAVASGSHTSHAISWSTGHVPTASAVCSFARSRRWRPRSTSPRWLPTTEMRGSRTPSVPPMTQRTRVSTASRSRWRPGWDWLHFYRPVLPQLVSALVLISGGAGSAAMGVLFLRIGFGEGGWVGIAWGSFFLLVGPLLWVAVLEATYKAGWENGDRLFGRPDESRSSHRDEGPLR